MIKLVPTRTSRASSAKLLPRPGSPPPVLVPGVVPPQVQDAALPLGGLPGVLLWQGTTLGIKK